MKYPPRPNAKDDVCECGHNICIHWHESKFFRSLYDDRPTGQCLLCLCPKFVALTGGSN